MFTAAFLCNVAAKSSYVRKEGEKWFPQKHLPRYVRNRIENSTQNVVFRITAVRSAACRIIYTNYFLWIKLRRVGGISLHAVYFICYYCYQFCLCRNIEHSRTFDLFFYFIFLFSRPFEILTYTCTHSLHDKIMVSIWYNRYTIAGMCFSESA